jgi:hypothetical protein
MPYAVNQGDVTTLKNLAASVSRTSTLTGTGVDLQGLDGEATVILDSSAATAGTNPTLDVKIQDSADGSSGWADVTGAAFTQVTSTASQQRISVNVSEIKRYVRAIGTLGGTSTPTFVYSVNLLGVAKYVA